MKVHVTVDIVVLRGMRVSQRDRAGLLARLEVRISEQLSGLPAQAWSAPSDALTTPIQDAVNAVLPPTGTGGRTWA